MARSNEARYQVEATDGADIIEFTPQALTPEAEQSWWEYLEMCERGAERARRVLGITAVREAGLE